MREAPEEYDPQHWKTKTLAHARAKQLLSILAEKLELSRKDVTIRSCMGGPAVEGEVILEHPLLRVVVLGESIDGGPPWRWVLFRDIKSPMEGYNRYMQVDQLLSSGLETLRNILYR